MIIAKLECVVGNTFLILIVFKAEKLVKVHSIIHLCIY